MSAPTSAQQLQQQLLAGEQSSQKGSQPDTMQLSEQRASDSTASTPVKSSRPVVVSSSSLLSRGGDDSQSGKVTSSPPAASNESTASSFGPGDDVYGVVTVSPLPLNMTWKLLRDYVQRTVDPPIQIARTKMLPGIGKLRIKSMPATIACANQLNNTVIAGTTVSAIPGPDEDLLHHHGQAAPGMHVHSPGIVYSPIMAPPQQLNHWTAQSPMTQHAAPGYIPHIQPYPMFGAPQFSGSPEMWNPQGSAPYYATQPYGFRPGSGTAGPGSGASGPPRMSSGINPSMMDKQRLFIGNIPFTTQWQDLKDHLRQAGNIYRVEIPEYEDGRSKGFAIATFYSEEDAKNAIRMFDKTDFNGREINVRYDRFRRWNAPGYQQAPQQWIQPLQENATSIGNSSQIAEQQDMPGQAESTAVPMDFVTVQQTQMQQFQQLSGNNAAVSMPRAPVESVAPGELPGQTHMPTPHDSEPSDTTSHISGGQGTAHTT